MTEKWTAVLLLPTRNNNNNIKKVVLLLISFSGTTSVVLFCTILLLTVLNCIMNEGIKSSIIWPLSLEIIASEKKKSKLPPLHAVSPLSVLRVCQQVPGRRGWR